MSTSQVPTTMTPTISRLMAGSSHSQPSVSTPMPPITTATDTAASPTMCMKAARMLRSVCRPEANSHAVRPLMTTPTAATPDHELDLQPVRAARKRSTASQAMAPIATSSSTELMSEERIVPRRYP